MARVTDHYRELLAKHYTWMFGSFDDVVAAHRKRLEQWNVRPTRSGQALDLGCGSGFQSVALADVGFQVTAIDLSEVLLAELATHQGERRITGIRADMRDLAHLVPAPFEVAVCMGDTLPHLSRREDVTRLFTDVGRLLEPGGLFIVSFRDLSKEAEGLERFIPVRSDDATIMTCFLEYEPEFVVVHDLVYTREGNGWSFQASNYRKLRLSVEWVIAQLEAAGFHVVNNEAERGMNYLVAS
jgi:SAM-dependent methyltransferase